MGGVCGLAENMSIIHGKDRIVGLTCIVACGIDYEEVFVFLLVQCRSEFNSV